MMELPFSTEQFLEGFRTYNTAICRYCINRMEGKNKEAAC